MMNPRFHKRRPARRGAMLVLIAICLPLILIMAAFAVDVAWMQLVRTELRTATDAASRAGAKELSLSQNIQTARQTAKQAARRNLVAGEPLRLQNKQIEIGESTQVNDSSRFKFTSGGSRPNAVRVTGKRTADSKAGPVDLLMGRLLGLETFQPQHVATSTQLDRDICLVVDRSGSMMYALSGNRMPTRQCDPPHPTKSRWGALATAVEAFLEELEDTAQDEHVAQVSYSSNYTACGNRYRISQVDSGLVSDYDAIREAMDRIGSESVQGATAIGVGLDDAIEVLTGRDVRPFAVKTIVLMTDGQHNTGHEPITSAREAAKKGIVIHTITFSDEADIARMKAVAEATGGRHFHAPDAEELERIFREIASTLPVVITQ